MIAEAALAGCGDRGLARKVGTGLEGRAEDGSVAPHQALLQLGKVVLVELAQCDLVRAAERGGKTDGLPDGAARAHHAGRGVGQMGCADEPTAGIDPILRARIWDNFRSLREQGKTLLVTTQYVGEAAYCDLVAVMRNGRLITIDTPRGLQRQAMGGEVIHMQIEEKSISKTVRFLEDQNEVSRVERQPNDAGDILVYVDDAGKELPGLLNLLRDEIDLTPQVAEPYLPPFDEVFVRLIQKDESLTAEKVAR